MTHRGTFSIYVDGRLVNNYSFRDSHLVRLPLSKQTTAIQTNIRVSGKNRRVGIHFQAQRGWSKFNRFQNTITSTLSAVEKNGPDFTVANVSYSLNKRCNIKLKNSGSVDSPANLKTQLIITVDDNQTITLSKHLPSLKANGGSINIAFAEPTAGIRPHSKVWVQLKMDNVFDEIDTTNNMTEFAFLDRSLLVPYKEILSRPEIRENIIWRGEYGIERYHDWSAKQKNDLKKAITAVEKGGFYGLNEPPLLFKRKYIRSKDAWIIFLSHVAQSLWVEVHRVVPWSLRSLHQSQLAYLLDSRNLITRDLRAPGFTFRNSSTGNITLWNPRIGYEFLCNLKMIKRSQIETIYAFTDWMRGRLIHKSFCHKDKEQYDYDGPPPMDKILYPLEGKKHVTPGCCGTSGLYAAVLRSVNIPVRVVFIRLNGGLHCRPDFMSVAKSMPHGDDVYTAVMIPSGYAIPSFKIFYTAEEMRRKNLHPPLDCVKQTIMHKCNTVSEQAAYNSEREQWHLAYQYMADYLLYQYAQHGSAYLDLSLQGPRVGDVVQHYIKPYFDDKERAVMLRQVQNRIKEIGQGDLELGKAKVINRFNNFLENK